MVAKSVPVTSFRSRLGIIERESLVSAQHFFLFPKEDFCHCCCCCVFSNDVKFSMVSFKVNL